jgi:hypothetical protein
MACNCADLHLDNKRKPWRNVVQVCNSEDRQVALRGRKGLAGTKLGLDEDLTLVQQARKLELWALFKEAKATSKRAFWCVAEFFINGTRICLPSSIMEHARGWCK